MTADHPLCSSGSRLCRTTPPRWEVADIVRLYGASYRQTHPVSPGQQRVLEAIAACRTAQQRAYRRCRSAASSATPTTPVAIGTVLSVRKTSPKRNGWQTARPFLRCPYFRTKSFTLPHALNALVLGNKRLLLGLLFTAASQTLLQFGRHNLGQLGGIMVLHTWDQLLNAHFHVHCLVPGVPWPMTAPVGCPRIQRFSSLSRPSCHTTAALTFSDATAAVATSQGFAHLLDHLYATAWVVYAKALFAGPAQVVVDYLGRYTHRIALTNSHLVDVHEGQVCFTYRNRREERLEQMTVDAHTFLRRFLLHVLPTGFVRLRRYGFLANRCKARTLPQCRRSCHPPRPPRQTLTVTQWMRQVMGVDLTQCPQCGARPLQRRPIPAAALLQGTQVLPARSMPSGYQHSCPGIGAALLAHITDSSLGLVCAYVQPQAGHQKALGPSLSPVGAWRAWRVHGFRTTSGASDLVDCSLCLHGPL